jgi:Holliday junction resolvase RusA-like endonuclease
MRSLFDSPEGILWLRVRYQPKLRLIVPGTFGRKGRLKAPEIAEAVRTAAAQEAKRAGWQAPPRAKLSVSLIFWGNDSSAPAIPNLVKFYLDVLAGVAFVDDRQISHLTAAFARGILCSPCPSGTTESEVSITIERLVDYNRRFDLCFQSDFEEDAEQTPELHEIESSPLDKSLLEIFPEETRYQIRKLERDRIQKCLLSHSKLGRYDRPGVHRTIRAANLMPTYEELRKSHPLIIDLGNLPQRHGESALYKAEILARIQQFKRSNKPLDRIGVPLDLDVRVGSDTLAVHKDLDNIMCDIMPILTQELFEKASLLFEYRIYVSDVLDESGKAKNLELTLLPMGAIRDLHRRIDEAEDWVADRI